MRPLKIFTGNTHGSYLDYLSQAPHEFDVLSKPGRPAGYGGRCGPIHWGPNVHDLPADSVRDATKPNVGLARSAFRPAWRPTYTQQQC